MNEAHVRAMFLLANIEIVSIEEIENKYWPDVEDYAKLRAKFPWFKVGTSHGVIVIGWRKRVINIDYSDTPLRHILTKDDVTKDETYCHAWSYGKAVDYLDIWKFLTQRQLANNV